MSVSNPNKIDAAAANDEELVLLITDHLRWDQYKVAHLQMLQDKLNTYIRYIDRKVYLNDFPGKEFNSFIIEVQFLHKYDTGFVKMIGLVKDELDKRKIRIRYSVNG